jgi:prepilin-type N-terminal cleavage/methylation domain-containing protein
MILASNMTTETFLNPQCSPQKNLHIDASQIDSLHHCSAKMSRLKAFYTHYNSGFTLIELIVVMSIMSIVLSMVGPLTLRMLDRAQAQSELISFKNSVKKVSYIAFASGTEYSFELKQHQLIVYRADDELQQTEFDHLNFEPQIITFNSRGYPSPEELSIKLLNKNEQVNLFKLVEGVDARIAQ